MKEYLKKMTRLFAETEVKAKDLSSYTKRHLDKALLAKRIEEQRIYQNMEKVIRALKANGINPCSKKEHQDKLKKLRYGIEGNKNEKN